MTKRILPGGLILVFMSQAYQAYRDKISGIYNAALQHRWMVMPIEKTLTPSLLKEMITAWKPIGCLIDPSQMTCRLDPEMVQGVPTVLIGPDFHRPEQVFDYTYQDAEGAVAIAVKALASRTLRSYGYVAHPAQPHWSVERGKFFTAATESTAPSSVYDRPSIETSQGQAAFSRWLTNLPKPAGLLLATDHLAASFYAAVKSAGFTIPDDLSVVSVDNIEAICRSVQPELTSVTLDFHRNGKLAIELLERRISHPKAPLTSRKYGVLGISNRASTGNVYTDARVRKALEYIHDHACEKRLSIEDIARQMNCGRRLAEKLFKAQTQMSITRHIQSVRIQTALDLLRNPTLPIEDIPSLCGYESTAYFKMFFHRTVGLSMRDWRKSQP